MPFYGTSPNGDKKCIDFVFLRLCRWPFEKWPNKTLLSVLLKTRISRGIQVFNMKIIMKRDSDGFYPENVRIGNVIKAVPFNLKTVSVKQSKAKLQNAAWLLSLFALHSRTLCIEVHPCDCLRNHILPSFSAEPQHAWTMIGYGFS